MLSNHRGTNDKPSTDGTNSSLDKTTFGELLGCARKLASKLVLIHPKINATCTFRIALVLADITGLL